MCGGGRNPSAGCSSQEDFCRSFWTDRAARTLEFSIGDDGCWRSEFKTLGRTPLSMHVRVLMRVEWIVIEAERFLAVYRFLCGPHASVWSVWCPCISQSQRRVVVGVVSFHYGKHHQFCPSPYHFGTDCFLGGLPCYLLGNAVKGTLEWKPGTNVCRLDWGLNWGCCSFAQRSVSQLRGRTCYHWMVVA